MNQPEIRERRFKLELYELNKNLELKREGDDDEEEDFVIRGKTTSTNQEVPEYNYDPATEKLNKAIDIPQKEEDKGEVLPPLCELISFSARFSLNDIPSATVVPAVGTEILYGGDKLSYDKIQELAVKNKPVGVYLTVLHRTRTFSDKEDIQYWPEKCCVFKGFVQPPMFEVSAYGSGRSIQLWHWLSSLASISMLTTACDIGNPIETTMQGYNLYVQAPTGTWGPLIEKAVSVKNIWRDGIKPLYEQILDWGEKKKKANNETKDIYNDLVETQRYRIRKAIGKIDQDTEVRRILNGKSYLDQLIARDLKTDSMSDFVQVDGWSKLISDYCPSYLMALSPRVDNATLIPIPCTVNPKETIAISLSEIFSIQAMPFIPKKISHITCVAAESPENNNTPIGTAHYVKLGVYPPKEIERDGINVTIGFPSWITQPAVGKIPDAPAIVDFLIDPKTAIKDADDEVKISEALNGVQNTVGQYYAQAAYLTQAFNSSFLRVAMPVNMNICPGAMVKIEQTKDGNLAFYGTVASVEVNLTSGNTAMTTVLTVSNIRDSTSVKDQVDNPQENVGFFTKQWSGKGVKLYAE